MEFNFQEMMAEASAKAEYNKFCEEVTKQNKHLNFDANLRLAVKKAEEHENSEKWRKFIEDDKQQLNNPAVMNMMKGMMKK